MTTPRRVVFVAANEEGARTGNERTTLRLAAALRKVGVSVEIVRPGMDAAFAATHLAALQPPPELVHAFHARRSGPRAARIAEALRVPLVVGVTGTDLAVDVFDEERAPVVLDTLRAAAAVTCGNPDERAAVGRLLVDAPP